jgi:NADH:ubiquinone oxidoreductase subunit K
VAAAEAAVGLAIILVIFRRRKSVRTEDLNGLKG